MNCDWTRENIVLYVYDELADDARHSFEEHVRNCENCAHELEAAMEFKNGFAALPVEEVSPSMLAASRMKLQESLEHAEQSRGLGRFVFDLAGWMHQIKLAPALTVALLMIGFAGGSLTTYRLAHVAPPRGPEPSTVDADIVGVDSVERAPDDRLTIHYKTQRPQTVTGAEDDPRIRALLLLGSRNTNNPAVQMETIDILQEKTQDDAVREALISSLRFDDNAEVRRKSLEALRSFVKNDVRVRDAMLEALVHDTNPGVRGEAIRLLDQVRADSSVRETLKTLAAKDKDSYIRYESKRVLANSPTLY